jgi:hypothetical protein
MIRWLSRLFGQIAQAFRAPQATVDRSRLVGMYLTQANQPPEPGAHGTPTRERQEGKYSQRRRRN